MILMEKTVVKREHNFLKVVCIVLGYVILIGAAMLTGYGIEDDASVLREAGQLTAVELAALIILAAIYFFVCRRLFPAAEEYQTRFSNKKIIIGIFFVSPLIVFIRANTINLNVDNIFGTVEARSWQELLEDFLFFPAAAVIGPVFEEMCCRVMGISLFSTKWGKIIALFMSSLLFALFHGANFMLHMPGAFIYGIILLWSRNIVLPMIIHIAWNTATFVVPAVSDIIVLCSPKMNFGIWGSPIAAVVLFVCAFLVGVYLIAAGFQNFIARECKLGKKMV